MGMRHACFILLSGCSLPSNSMRSGSQDLLSVLHYGVQEGALACKSCQCGGFQRCGGVRLEWRCKDLLKSWQASQHKVMV
jgi:hypothetical protein